ncbi:MAG: MaoC family dehydratase [Chloroflexi bacterium]|nr:MaoC family dehydratase [Chloroflexota bacterium]
MSISVSDLKPGFSLVDTKTISTEEVLSFCRRERELEGRPIDQKNIHTDEEVARSFGLRGVVAPGVQTMPYIWDLLREAFGERWTRGGKLAVTFTNMVCGGDTLTTQAVVREPAENEPTNRLYLDTWMENQRGEKVIVGKASVPID